jgi:zinc transport system ATP-binding protein
MSVSAISIKNLNFQYTNSPVLTDVNLEVAEKNFLALIGPNGGGKSTLLKLMTGLLKPTAGEVSIYGKSPEQYYSHIGYVPQNTNMNNTFPITALEVVLMGHECEKRSLFGYGKHEVACAEGALERVGMLEFKDEKIGLLSGGQRQRVMIARALCAANTKILFFDEPTASLDVQGQHDIYMILKEISKTITVVVVSHDLSVILDFATCIAHVNRTLKYHHAPSVTSEKIIEMLGIKDNHLCEVDILNSLGKKFITPLTDYEK